MKLQVFLQEFEGADVEITGIYDEKTTFAVAHFQTKYAEDILTPWGITEPTGYAYITTTRKINEIACNASVEFTEKEEVVLATYVTKEPVFVGVPREIPTYILNEGAELRKEFIETYVEPLDTPIDLYNPLHIYDDYYILPGSAIWKFIKNDVRDFRVVPGDFELHAENIYIKVN
ncbi:hypothetical protein COB55_01930 [Candidatus Wolfebacteria bacterium]|nr:MAG: hypothetical protein COB55_01930 [Candidatus Wolfebacteria bacterium]